MKKSLLRGWNAKDLWTPSEQVLRPRSFQQKTKQCFRTIKSPKRMTMFTSIPKRTSSSYRISLPVDEYNLKFPNCLRIGIPLGHKFWIFMSSLCSRLKSLRSVKYHRKLESSFLVFSKNSMIFCLIVCLTLEMLAYLLYQYFSLSE